MRHSVDANVDVDAGLQYSIRKKNLKTQFLIVCCELEP